MIEILRTRRSVRVFEDREIEPEKIRTLQEALLSSPSSRSINPWEFIFISEKQALELLAQSKPHGASFLSGAALAVVVLGNRSGSDTCIEDCSIAAITLQYAAQSLGLGSCWCQIRLRAHEENMSAEDFVRDLLGIPDHYLVECIVALGYPAQRPSPHGDKNLDWGKIKEDRWG